MPAVLLSPIFNAVAQPTEGWLPLNEGKIYTYAAGTSTPLATYTTALGNVQNANPIILGVDGRPPHEIWLLEGASYLFTLTDSDDNLIQNYDDITGIGSGDAACCTEFGHATSEDGQAFEVTFDVTISELTQGRQFNVVFDDEQTVSEPTLEVNGLAAVTIKDANRGTIAPCRIQENDLVTVVYDQDNNCFYALNLAPLETCAIGPTDQESIITAITYFTFPSFPGGKVIAVRGGVAVASSSGSVSLDIREGGVSILSTVITVEQGETSSLDATTQPVISDRTIANGATVTFICTGAGTNAQGPMWEILYRRTANTN